MNKKSHTVCSQEIMTVIRFNGVFALTGLAAAIGLMAISMLRDKNLDNAILIALIVQPMGVALQSLTNLVTQSKDQATSGTHIDPVTVKVEQPASDPIPVTSEESESGRG